MNRKIKRPDLTNLREQMKQEREDVTALAAIEKPLIGSTDIDLSLANLTTDENINKILRESMLEFVNQTVKNKLWLGNHLQKIFELLGNGAEANQYTSCYSEYLRIININPKTARRYRKRYTVFMSTESQNFKKLIVMLSDEDIQFLDDNPPFLEKITKQFENGEVTKEQFKELKAISYNITTEKKDSSLSEVNVNVLPAFTFDDFSLKIDDIQGKVKNLIANNAVDDNTFTQVKKYLDKIDQLLNKTNI